MLRLSQLSGKSCADGSLLVAASRDGSSRVCRLRKECICLVETCWLAASSRYFVKYESGTLILHEPDRDRDLSLISLGNIRITHGVPSLFRYVNDAIAYRQCPDSLTTA